MGGLLKSSGTGTMLEVREKVDQLKGIMQDNVKKILETHVTLESLEIRPQQLEFQLLNEFAGIKLSEASAFASVPQIQCRNLKIKAICGAAAMIHQQFFQVRGVRLRERWQYVSANSAQGIGGLPLVDSVLDAHHGDRRDDDDTTVSERLDQLECRDPKARLEQKWATWQRNSALPPAQRPKKKPSPWKLQVYTEFLDYVKDAMSSGPTAPASEEALVPLLQSSPAVEAERHGSAKDGKAWPIVLVVRNRESGQATCEH
ncbi:hypothetical protein AK812_SmicGene13268 [Symbiodinium microadriaticum]|uniref:Uncharacterized protein n=1 Tax=Symbiodinium microadriaticum TaxID=2951 RepID=A0A1Q9E8K1_SYMMI|nr:hypothetical protein AK812_SmicGene13268 [Symbiodinium microadriaticum]